MAPIRSPNRLEAKAGRAESRACSRVVKRETEENERSTSEDSEDIPARSENIKIYSFRKAKSYWNPVWRQGTIPLRFEKAGRKKKNPRQLKATYTTSISPGGPPEWTSCYRDQSERGNGEGV